MARTTRRRPARTGAWIAVSLLVLTACDGGETLSHDELVSKANAICAEPVSQAQAIVEAPPDAAAGLDEAWVQQVQEAAPLIRTAAQGLATLEPSADDEEVYTGLVAAYETLADTMENAADAAAAGDAALVAQQLPTALTALEDADAAATELGIGECSRAGAA